MRRAQQNPRDFEALYERYYDELFYFVLKRVCGESDTADICSQVFLKAMINLPKYQFRGLPYSSFLYRVAINEVNHYFRSTRRKVQLQLDEKDVVGLLGATENEGVNQEEFECLRLVLAKLKDREKQLVELRYFEKMSYAEIGGILGYSENNAKVKMHRLLQKIRKLYQKMN